MRRADVRLVRAAFALVATGVIWLAAAPAAQAVDNPLSITVKVGYSGFIKTQQWIRWAAVSVSVAKSSITSRSKARRWIADR